MWPSAWILFGVFLYKTCTHFYWQWPRLVFSSGYSPRGSFFSLLRNNTETLVLGQNLCTRIWVCAMIGLFKKPVLICQTGWREIWNSFPVIRWVRCGPKTRISALFNPFTAKFSQEQISTNCPNLILWNFEKQIEPCVSTGRELSFQWSHHRISSADSKVRVTSQDSIKRSGSGRVKERGKESTFCRSSYRPLSSHQCVWREHRRITGKILQNRQKEA